MTEEWPAPHLVEDPRVVDIPRPRVIGLDGRPSAASAPRRAAVQDPAVQVRLAFAARAARYLASDAGVRQFLDVCSGLPTCDAVLDAVGDRAPDVRAVYADASCGPVLHPGTSPHSAAAPVVSLGGPGADAMVHSLLECGLVDFDRPVAVLLLDTALRDRPAGLRGELMDALFPALSPGSHVIVSESAATRSSDPFGPFSAIDPGLADGAWWPYPDEAVADERSGITAGVGRRDPRAESVRK